jgi:hypothetical protein
MGPVAQFTTPVTSVAFLRPVSTIPAPAPAPVPASTAMTVVTAATITISAAARATGAARPLLLCLALDTPHIPLLLDEIQLAILLQR